MRVSLHEGAQKAAKSVPAALHEGFQSATAARPSRPATAFVPYAKWSGMFASRKSAITWYGTQKQTNGKK
jgi:hypothetical protein